MRDDLISLLPCLTAVQRPRCVGGRVVFWADGERCHLSACLPSHVRQCSPAAVQGLGNPEIKDIYDCVREAELEGGESTKDYTGWEVGGMGWTVRIHE